MTVLTVGLRKKVLLYKMSYFPEPYTRSKSKRKVKWDLFNYVTKFDLKKASSINTSIFLNKSDLASLKSDIDDLDNDKLRPLPVDYIS